ncbi:MAG: phytanoyl-CoA dioxygenase family protein [Cytophagales bacterium]|nr:phytanoyl-CoA dioxygenase family protein [Armatimonadota bacterium]
MPTTATNTIEVAPRSLTGDEIRFYKEKGYLVLPGLLSQEAAEALRGEVMGIMEVIGLGQTKLKQSHEYLQDSALDAFVNSSALLAVAESLMEGPGMLYLPFTAVKSGGGGGQFHFHQDNQYTRFDGPGINLWTALTPMTLENGCLQVVPRSHLAGTLDSHSPDGDGHKAVTLDPESFVSIPMAPGDCIAFSRLTVHGSGPNLSLEPRVAYAVQYHREDVHYSLDGGESWKLARENPRWTTGPVSEITVPKGKLDGH